MSRFLTIITSSIDTFLRTLGSCPVLVTGFSPTRLYAFTSLGLVGLQISHHYITYAAANICRYLSFSQINLRLYPMSNCVQLLILLLLLGTRIRSFDISIHLQPYWFEDVIATDTWISFLIGRVLLLSYFRNCMWGVWTWLFWSIRIITRDYFVVHLKLWSKL